MLWVEVISVLLGTVRPLIVSVLKCTVMVLTPANGTMRMVVLRVVLGLNAAVLFVLAATTLVEGPIFHDVEFPPCFTYTPVQLVIVLLGNMVMPEIVLGLGHYRHVESCEGGWYRARWVHAIIVQLDKESVKPRYHPGQEI